MNDCFSGLGERSTWWCDGLEDYYVVDEKNYGKLQYLPSGSGASNVVNELSLLLTAGRLGSASKQIIREAYNGQADSADGLRLAQKLFAATPEFHTSAVFDKSATDRPEVKNPTSTNDRYKAVSMLGILNLLLFFSRVLNQTLHLHAGCILDVGWWK